MSVVIISINNAILGLTVVVWLEFSIFVNIAFEVCGLKKLFESWQEQQQSADWVKLVCQLWYISVCNPVENC